MTLVTVFAAFLDVTGAYCLFLNELRLKVGTGWILLPGMDFFMSFKLLCWVVGYRSITVVWLRNF